MTGDPHTAMLLQRARADQDSGQLRQAEERYRAILEHDPGHLEARYGAAALAYQAGRPDDAMQLMRHDSVLQARNADCLNLLGLCHLATGQPDTAARCFRDAVALDSAFHDALNNLGAAEEARGRFAEAEAAFREAFRLHPDYAEAVCNLGRVLLRLGRPAESAAASRQAIDLQPGLIDARFNLAVAQHRQKQDASAEQTLQAAIALDPQNSELYRFLGVLRRRAGDLSGAQEALQRALALSPALVEAQDNLAAVLLDQGNADAAQELFAQALRQAPENRHIHSNLLLCLNYREADPAVLFEAHRGWAARHEVPAPAMTPASADGRRLKVGYVSGDFRRHSVAYFFEPLPLHHDRSRFEVTCYATGEERDDVTDRLVEAADNWCWVSGLDDAQLADRVRADGIDILVDLSGHTAGNRLGVFVRRAAPVQASWCGYPNTTGLDAMDYRLVDAITDPPEADACASERLIRLEDGFLCYLPVADAPKVAPLPFDRNGFVTFGSFNNLRKVTPQVIETWSQLLARLPQARLVLKARPLADGDTAARYRALFAAQGVDPGRVALRGPIAGFAGHLAAYDEVDIALDPFPYNGTTTTCEALWMGVPTITLRGRTHAGRVGASLLTRVGLTQCIAGNSESYSEAAENFAGDIDGLRSLRAGLRQRMADSPLCDAAGFTRRMEVAFERMWREKGQS